MIDLDELERLEREATAGPWDSDGNSIRSRAPLPASHMVATTSMAPHMRHAESNAIFIAALRNAARELIADAKRYRWLRDAPTADLIVVGDTGNVDVGMSSIVGTYESEFTGQELDAAIDAAIAKEKQ